MPQSQLDIGLHDTYSLSSIGFVDLSQYYNNNVSNPSFELTPPGFNKVNLPWVHSHVNIFKSEDILPGCNINAELPDGVYTVKYSVSPNTTTKVEKTFLRVTKITARLQKAFLSLELGCDCQQNDKTKIFQVKLLIEGAVASANNCDNRTAIRLLGKANKQLDSLANCDC